MKKLVLLLVILALAIALVACGGPAETDAPETDPPETETNPTETDPSEPEHVHDVQVEELAPTCSERGYYSEVCKTCGETLSVTALPKIACTPSGEATCTADSVCTVCGAVLEAAKGHAWGDKQTVVSTCIAEGKETITCTVCQAVEEKVIPMISHVIGVADEEKEATCSEDGYRTGACVMCEAVVTETLVAAHEYILESFFTAEDGTLMASCFICGDVPVRSETRMHLDFDKDVEEELAAQEYADMLRLVDSKVSPQYKKASAVLTTNGDRTVLAPTLPVAIDFDGELLYDARYFMISFDFYISKIPQPDDPSNPLRATLFNFVPGFQGGTQASEGRINHANFTKLTYGQGFVFSQYGMLTDITNGAVVVEAQPENWYTFTYIVDNVTGEAYAYLDGQFIACPILDDESDGLFAVNAENDKKYDGFYCMCFGDGHVKKHGGQYDNFTISVIR